MSEILSVDDDGALGTAADALRAGDLVVAPTDTVYAVLADVFEPSVTRRLLRTRGVGRNRPLTVLLGTTYQLRALCRDVPAEAQRLIDAHWPGPLTLVLPAATGIDIDLGNTYGTVAVRLPDEPWLRELVQEVGPLASSGASRRGRPAATDVDAAQGQLGDAVAVYVDGGVRDAPRSTIVDASRDDDVHVLREGPIDPHGSEEPDETDGTDGTGEADETGQADGRAGAVGEAGASEAAEGSPAELED